MTSAPVRSVNGVMVNDVMEHSLHAAFAGETLSLQPRGVKQRS
jgi:hypothetical protein